MIEQGTAPDGNSSKLFLDPLPARIHNIICPITGGFRPNLIVVNLSGSTIYTLLLSVFVYSEMICFRLVDIIIIVVIALAANQAIPIPGNPSGLSKA